MIQGTKWTRVCGTLLVTVCAAFALNGCADGGSVEDEGAPYEDVGEGTEALFDTAVMDTTAKQALLAAGAATVASPFDIFGIGVQVEYCGLVVKKANGTFRAGVPVTQYLEKKCTATEPLAAGEKVVGYYHTHTPASVTGFSPADKTAAASSGRQYYVISTVNACAQRYNPTTGATTSLGCFPGSF